MLVLPQHVSTGHCWRLFTVADTFVRIKPFCFTDDFPSFSSIQAWRCALCFNECIFWWTDELMCLLHFSTKTRATLTPLFNIYYLYTTNKSLVVDKELIWKEPLARLYKRVLLNGMKQFRNSFQKLWHLYSCTFKTNRKNEAGKLISVSYIYQILITVQ